MGYSARYHAASLAAVFLALAVGILIGVGFGSDVVSGTADELEESLGADLDEARERVAELEADLEREAQLGELVYPALVGRKLNGADVGIVGLGGLDEETAGDVRAALDSAGATLREVAEVREPPDADALVDALLGERDRRVPRAAALEGAARRAGRLLAEGGARFDSLRAALLGRYSGRPQGIDALVLVRERLEELEGRDAADTDALEDGLVEGMTRAGVTVVGVERSEEETSDVDFFADRGAATIDNVDQLPGRVALVYALDGAEGNFGVKESADALLPDLLDPVALGGSAGASAQSP